MVYTYVPGPIHEADTSAAVQLRQAATELMSGMTRRCLDGTVPAARPDERYGTFNAIHKRSCTQFAPAVVGASA